MLRRCAAKLQLVNEYCHHTIPSRHLSRYIFILSTDLAGNQKVAFSEVRKNQLLHLRIYKEVADTYPFTHWFLILSLTYTEVFAIANDFPFWAIFADRLRALVHHRP